MRESHGIYREGYFSSRFFSFLPVLLFQQDWIPKAY